MAAQRGLKPRNPAAKPDKDTAIAVKKAKAKERTGLKPEVALAEAKKALSASKAEVRHERQARIKAEKALAKAQQASAAAGLVAELERQAPVKRVSFVVRLTVDEHGQPRRTEIEVVDSSRKQNFLGLDSERLVAFMKAYISPTIVPEHAIPAVPPPVPSVKVEAPTPGPLRPKSSLIISDVRVFRPGHPEFMTLTLTSKEPFVVQARFQLLGLEASSLTAQESFYETRVYAKEFTSGKSMLLTTCTAELIQDILEYGALAEVPGLPPGLYRLFIVVTLRAPTKMAGFHETFIHVI